MSESPLRSRIERVTVYSLGAEVVRVADVPALAPPSTVTLGGLPLCAHESSFQLAVEPLPGGDPAAVPLAVGLTLGFEPPPPDPTLPPALDEELRAAERSLERAEVEQARIERQLAALEDLHSPARPEGAEGEPPPPAPTAARLAILAFRRAEQESMIAALGPAREACRVAREDLAAVKARRAADPEKRQLAPHELRRSARIDLVPPPGGGGAAPFRLRVSYLVPTARWAPAYHLAIDPPAGRAVLSLRALICQAGDEDWRGVQVTLSTADALQWAELPRLPALRIGRARPTPPPTGWRPAPLGAEALFSDYDRAFGRPAAPRTAHVAARPPAPAQQEADLVLAADDEFQAAEAPAPPQAKAARLRRAVPVARSVPPPACAAPAAGAAMPARGAFAQAPADEPEVPEPPSALAAGATLLDYDALRMPSPADPERGRLRPPRPEERLRAPATGERLPDAHALAQHIASLAESVRRLPLPPGHVPPRGEGAFDHAWRADLPVDVQGDGRFHAIPVHAVALDAALVHVAAPRASREAFRVLRLRNALAAPLLEGPVDVEIGTRSLPTCRMPPVAPGGRAELGLGVEERLRIARNSRFTEQTRGMVARQLELLHEIVIEVRSLLPQPAALEVRERLPVVREDEPDIRVEPRAIEPAWEPWEQPEAPLRGGHCWKLTLEPGQVRRLRASYAVTLPAKLELVGGNRREG